MKKNTSLLVSGVIVGLLLSLGPIWGFVYTRLFILADLDSSGVANPQALALDIGHGLMIGVAGFIACPIGLVILALSIVFLVRKPSLAPLPNSR